MKNYCTRFLLLPATVALAISIPAWASDLLVPSLTPCTINPNVTQVNTPSSRSASA